MKIELSPEDIETLLESLEYSKLAIRNAQGAPYPVRQGNLARLDAAEAKLRAMKRAKDS